MHSVLSRSTLSLWQLARCLSVARPCTPPSCSLVPHHPHLLFFKKQQAEAHLALALMLCDAEHIVAPFNFAHGIIRTAHAHSYQKAIIFKKTLAKTTNNRREGSSYDIADNASDDDDYTPTPASATAAVAAAYGGGGGGGGAAADPSSAAAPVRTKRKVKQSANSVRSAPRIGLAAGSWRTKAGTGAGATTSPPQWTAGDDHATNGDVDSYLGMQPDTTGVDEVFLECGLGAPQQIGSTRKHKCPQCGKVSGTMKDCRKHMVSHLEAADRPYCCPVSICLYRSFERRVHVLACEL